MSAGEKQAASARSDELEKQIMRLAKVGLPALIVLLALVAGVVIDVATAILILAAGALLGVIAMLWASLRTLLGETPLSGADAYAIGAPPRAEEEQKRAVIRALKDLEFEHAVGKISDEDYQVLVTKYRAEAKRLLQLLDVDAAPRRGRVEAIVLRRLQREGLLESAPAEVEADGDAEARGEEGAAPDGGAAEKPVVQPEASASAKASAGAEKDAKRRDRPAGAAARKKKKAKPADAAPPATRACNACSASNDVDAVFCKKCGARLAAAAPAETGTQAAIDDEAGA
jgi:hypothetical protein